MARQRLLSPEFFTDAKVLKLAPAERLLFQGLWCEADRVGVFIDAPEDLGVRYVPREMFERAVDPEAAVARMAEMGLVVRYIGSIQAKDREGLPKGPPRSARLGWIPKFLAYQRPHPNEQHSGRSLPPQCVGVTNGKEPEVYLRANLGAPDSSGVGVGVGVGVDRDNPPNPPSRGARKRRARVEETERPDGMRYASGVPAVDRLRPGNAGEGRVIHLGTDEAAEWLNGVPLPKAIP
jgi:hypothetical protein